MSQLTTRDATPNDLPRLTELCQAQYDIIRQLDPRYSAEKPAAALTGIIDSANASVYVATRADGPILGYIIGSANPPRVEQLVIDAHFGSGGVGTALLKALTHTFRANGITTYTVDVPRHHAVQQAFWRAKGARVIATNDATRIETMQIHIKDSD